MFCRFNNSNSSKETYWLLFNHHINLTILTIKTLEFEETFILNNHYVYHNKKF
jgi:hypothetical protein